MQALQKQVKDLQSGNTSLQNERERLSEALQVITIQKNLMVKNSTRSLFLESAKKILHPESGSKISNHMITELYYLHILKMSRGFLQTRSFRGKQIIWLKLGILTHSRPASDKFPGAFKK